MPSLLAVLLALLLTACSGPVVASPSPSAVSSALPTTTPTPARRPVVVLDPGHNGGNGTHTAEITRLVPAGRGKTKACNTTGTATVDGYPEHAFTWDLADRVRTLLLAHGVEVVLTRPDDAGVGPCVDQRASVGNAVGADAVVSLHADGSTRPDATGFHIAYSDPPLHDAQRAPATRLTLALRDALLAAGFPASNYVGRDGLSPRSDLAGLNLSTRPAALIECGNMRHPGEAAVLSSAAGRARYSAAVADGILGFIGRGRP